MMRCGLENMNADRSTRQKLGLTLAALGVVYGDIGTSPLYAFRECFHGAHGLAPDPAHVLGVLSLIFWSLLIIVSLKYLVFVMRADNHGEGGILALLALAMPETGRAQGVRRALVLGGVFGAALIYGDGIPVQHPRAGQRPVGIDADQQLNGPAVAIRRIRRRKQRHRLTVLSRPVDRDRLIGPQPLRGHDVDAVFRHPVVVAIRRH